ncbi:MAG: hypothetical protein K0S76_2602 [Herbinix sp.]|jgi:hypothetical protein|nr:hypothetical protein [Herbinix sp.]
MNQIYAEAGVKRKDTASTMGLRLLLILGIVAGFFISMLGSFFSIIGVAIIVVLGYLFPKLNVEYEYVFVDGQLDFDRISGKSKRKTLLRIDLEQVDIVAPANSHAMDSYANIQSEKKDFTSRNANSKPYVIIANVQNKKAFIYFEPSEKMITMMKQKSPRKVTTY